MKNRGCQVARIGLSLASLIVRCQPMRSPPTMLVGLVIALALMSLAACSDEPPTPTPTATPTAVPTPTGTPTPDHLETISKWTGDAFAGTTIVRKLIVTARGSWPPSCRSGSRPHDIWRATPASVLQPTGEPDTA